MSELLSERLLIWFLTLLFLVELLDPERSNSPIINGLANFGKDIQQYIATTAATGAVAAIVNLLLLTIRGVDFAVVWCVVYFLLHFIPNFGFMIALVPPTLLALLMLGWRKALVVFFGLVLTESVGENDLKPLLLKKTLDVSLIEVTVSLLDWGFLIGPAGAVLSLPLTLALRRIIEGARRNASPMGSPVASRYEMSSRCAGSERPGGKGARVGPAVTPQVGLKERSVLSAALVLTETVSILRQRRRLYGCWPLKGT